MDKKTIKIRVGSSMLRRQFALIDVITIKIWGQRIEETAS